ncbi:MAG TPA: cbb3-type cytochrome c oxidase subunit I [Acidimicrobiales bacterium]|jgi:heme/copper-type cytochrome/quinol oxidase subunit 1|nr:cbb3-type cytochrome c oxidase subunit I [Acidimicrobiales bacterium]
MTTIDTTSETVLAASDREEAAATLEGVAGWTSTVDHVRIGGLFAGSALLATLGVFVLGGIWGIERVDASDALLGGAAGQVGSLYWYGLAFAAVTPLLVGVAIAVVPLQLGVPAIAFPRAAALSYWGWLFGAVVMVGAYIADGGPGGGVDEAVDLFLAGLVVVTGALTLGAVCLAATVLTARAPGMGLLETPAFAFSSLVYASALVVLLPMVAAKAVQLYVDHRYGGPAFGGTLGIGPNLDWSFLQAANLVHAIPALGLLGEVVPVIAGRRQPMRPVLLVGLGLGAFAVIPAAFQGVFILDVPSGTAVFTILQRLAMYALTALLPILPFLVVLGAVGLCLKGARPRIVSAFVFALAAVLMTWVGALAGALTPIDDLPGGALAGTQFQAGQANYALLGALLAGLGGLAWWGPKLWGRHSADAPLVGFAGLALIGVVLVSLADVIAGFLDQPLNDPAFEVDGPHALLAVAYTAGQAVLFLAVAASALVFWRGARRGEPTGDDPWGGHTLEWAMPSPPGSRAAETAMVTTPEPLLDRAADGDR